MTKKSHAKLQRHMQKKDAQKQQRKMLRENRVWDDVENMRAGCIASLLTIKSVADMAKDPEFIRRAGQEFANLVIILAKDSDNFTKQIQAIAERHVGKEGKCRNEDEVMEALIIGQDYIGLQNTIQSVIFPCLQRAMEIAESVRFQMAEENNATIQPSLDAEEKQELDETIAAIKEAAAENEAMEENPETEIVEGQ